MIWRFGVRGFPPIRLKNGEWMGHTAPRLTISESDGAHDPYIWGRFVRRSHQVKGLRKKINSPGCGER